jgi:hypothetical protein
MAKSRKVPQSWQGKLYASNTVVVKPAPTDIAGMKAGQVMLVPTPQLIEAFVRAIPKGEAMDVKTMRAALATTHRAEVTCPIYTGYHLRTVAEAAYEQHQMGAPLAEIAPFWRVIDVKTPTAKRLACGTEFVRRQRVAEGLAP